MELPEFQHLPEPMKALIMRLSEYGLEAIDDDWLHEEFGPGVYRMTSLPLCVLEDWCRELGLHPDRDVHLLNQWGLLNILRGPPYPAYFPSLRCHEVALLVNSSVKSPSNEQVLNHIHSFLKGDRFALVKYLYERFGIYVGFEDFVEDVFGGKKKSDRAIQQQIRNINDELERFHTSLLIDMSGATAALTKSSASADPSHK